MVFLMLLAGCTTRPVSTGAVTATENAGELVEPEQTPPESPEKVSVPVRPFPEDALYQLLLAEISGYRGAYDEALAIYREQALRLQDPGVAARAARLARYLKKNDVLAEVAAVWSELEPSHMEPWQYLTDFAIQQEDYQSALRYMSKIDGLGGEVKFDFFAYRAQSLSEESARALLESMRSLNLDNLQHLQFSRAALLERVGQFEDALILAQDLNDEFPEEVNYLILRINLLDRLSRHEEAKVTLEKVLGEQESGLRVQKLYAQQLLKLQDLEGAKLAYGEILKDAPEDGDVLFALALLEIEDDEFESARRHLLRQTRLGHRTNEAHYYLGVVAEAMGQTALAMREYETVNGGYQWLPAQRRLADLIVDQEGLDEARAFVAARRQAMPQLTQQLIMLEAQLLVDRSEPPVVLAFLDAVVDRDPSNITLLYYRGMVGQQFGRLDILERDLTHVLTLHPEHADAMNSLGYTLADQTDRYEEALALIERALAIRPDEPAFIDSMGWVLFKLGRLDEALIQLERAYELFSNDEVASHLGEVLWSLGEKRKAKKVWREAIKKTPDSPYLLDVYKRFEL